MKRVGKETVEALRAHAKSHPQDTYAQMAASFGVSEISVKRYCAGLGRGKNWRSGRRQASPNAGKFWASVDRASDGCWPWKGCRNSSGYGTVHFDGTSQGTHRVAYLLKHGAIPEGREIDHLCRNRACCNPAHLEAITHEKNMERVRQVQAEMAGGPQRTAPSLIDPGHRIDTRRENHSGAGDAVVPSIINGESLSSKPGKLKPVSVSIARGLSEQTMNGADPSVEEASDLWWRAHEIWGQCRDVRRRAEDGSDDFKYYDVKVDGVGFRMIARSEFDARSIVEKFWGTTSTMSVDEDGKPDADSIGDWLDNWFRYLSPHLAKWKCTEPGQEWVARKDEKKRDERNRRDNAQATWYLNWEDSQERRLTSSSRGIGSSAGKAHRPSYEDYAPDEDYDSDDSEAD